MIKESELRMKNGDTVIGVVRDIGTIYADGTPCIEIHIAIGATGTLPLRLGARIPVRLRIGEYEVRAGLRATPRNKYAWICPDVYLLDRVRRTLGSVLSEAGFSPKDRVRLTFEDDFITLTHERPGLPAPLGEPRRTELESVRSLPDPPRPGALEEFGQLARYQLEGKQKAMFQAQFELVRMNLVLATLATAQ